MAKDVKFNIKLNVDGKNVVVSASTNVKQLADNLGLVKDNVSAADKEFMRWTQSVMALDSVTNSLRQISDVLNTITEDSRSFGAAMKAANTMAGKNAEGFNRLKGQVAELSKTVPLARDELAKGLYQVISNGVPENNWISYLQASSKAAVGGIANLEEVVKVTSTVIKNYGLEWSAAEDIQDKIQLTAKNGVTSFEQLAAALPSVTGQAAQLGVSFTEMLAVMATLTGVTGNTADVSTQLASVLTALTKESSKSQKMAQEMGISFDAASIKAAGGLRNFLQELDKTITAYSQKTGELKESIYSKLFGRAEALRLVNALTGNLAAKFDENIKALDNSAGTIDKAFDEMSSTGSATTQMLKNQAAKFQDVISSVIGAVQPYLNFTTQMGITTLSIMNLSKALKGLHIMQKIAAVPTKLMSVAMLLCGLRGTRAAAGVRVFSAALKGVAYSSTAAKLALRGLLISTGVGAAIAALTFVVEKLIDAFDHTGDAADDAVNSIDTVGESAKSAQQAFTSAQSETYSRLMTKYTELQTSWKALTSAHAKAQWIKQHAEDFEKLGVKIGGVVDAEQVFSKNTDAVVQSFVARAKAAARLAQLTEEYRIQMSLADKIGRANDAAQARHTVKAGDRVAQGFGASGGHTTEGGYEYVAPNGQWVYTDKGAAKNNSQPPRA
ncbi:MAG: phage tail tape measure protein [Prevotellaceae bacterium]|nr:phage tail tape measure protein [Prevotellaceae bacterium]MDY3857007.1 phage tail tape measure protein [Bacteroidaceae bacterium]